MRFTFLYNRSTLQIPLSKWTNGRFRGSAEKTLKGKFKINRTQRKVVESMRRWNWLFAIFLLCGCAKVLAVRDIPPINVGQASFFPTIEAHTDATITAGNRIDILLNGDQTYPAILSEIRHAQSTIAGGYDDVITGSGNGFSERRLTCYGRYPSY